MTASYPALRLQRLRRTPGIRALTAQTPLPYSRYIWPVFLVEGTGVRAPIPAMPGQFRFSIDALIEALKPLVEAGLGGVMLFGVVESGCKTPGGDYAFAPDGLVQRGVAALKKVFPGLLVWTDVCLCEYTTTGHCHIGSDPAHFDPEVTCDVLRKIAVSHARAGADGVAPSAMADGQIRAIRSGLEEARFYQTLLMSYSSKFASAFYDPFRDAADSAPQSGDRRSYQADGDSLELSLLESLLDEAEGADILMVKPAMLYLDVLSKVKSATHLPLAAYNVSGEYAMMAAAFEQGILRRKPALRELFGSIQRAGADIILSYWASEYPALFLQD